MNLMQSKLQQIYKDYLDLKNFIAEDSKNIESLKKEVLEEAMLLDTVEDQAGLYFEKLGNREILKIDFLEAQKKLYYFVKAYEDLVEIDEIIKNEVAEYKIKTVFAIIDGKKEIIDKDLYNSYKKQNQEYSVQLDRYNQIIKNSNYEGAQ